MGRSAKDDLDYQAGSYLTAIAMAHKCRDNLRAAVIRAVSEGMSESEAARRAGVTRQTVRFWLGK